MSQKETPLKKRDLHNIRRFIDDDGVPRFTVGKVRGLTYHQAYDEIVKQTGCRTTTDPKGTSTWSREGIRRLGALNDAYWAAARQFISEKSVARKVEQFNAQKKANESQPTTPSEPQRNAEATAAAPKTVPDAGGAQDLAGEPQRAGGHADDLARGVPPNDGGDDQRPTDAARPESDGRGDSEPPRQLLADPT